MEDVKSRALNHINAVSAHAVERSPPSTCSEDAPVCWICLDYSSPLIFPCNCPRTAHPKCLARWQLQSAGTRKETHCEFCDENLLDWKAVLTPQCGSNAPAVMNVNFDGRTYSFEVKPGPDGYSQFTEAIRRAFSLPEDSELNITFTCDEPTAAAEAGTLLTLQGAGAYDAAVHCASVSAARRLGGPSLSRSASSASDQVMSQVSSPLAGGARPGHAAAQQQQLAGPPGQEAGALAAPAGPGAGLGKRRLSGLGRKLRSALADLLGPRQ